MISKEALIQALTQQLNAANAGNAQQTREALSAIRALCDAALNAVQSTEPTYAAPPIQHVQQQTVVPPTLPTAKRVEEDGANGDSIFDF